MRLKLVVTTDCLRLDASRELFKQLSSLLSGYVKLDYTPVFTQGVPTPPSIFNYMLFGRFYAYYAGRLGEVLDYSRLPSVPRLLARRGWGTALIAGFNPFHFKFFGWGRQFQYHYAIGDGSGAGLPRRLSLARRLILWASRRLKRLLARPLPIDVIGLISSIIGRIIDEKLRCPPSEASSSVDWKPVRESVAVAREVLRYARSLDSRSALVWVHVNDLHTPLYNPHERSVGDCLAENVIDSLIGVLHARSLSAQLVASRAISLYWENVKVVAAAIAVMIKSLLELMPEGELDLLILGDHGEGLLSQPPPWEPEARGRELLVFGHEQLSLDLYFTGAIYSRGLLEYTPRVSGYAPAATAVKEASLSGAVSEYKLRRLMEVYWDFEHSRGLVASESARVDFKVRSMREVAVLSSEGLVASSGGWCTTFEEHNGRMVTVESWKCSLGVEAPKLLVEEHRSLLRVASALLLAT